MHALLLGLWLTSAAYASPVDLNTATRDALQGLPGVGPSKAAAVVTWRERHGPFQRISDLDAVPGFGVATLAALREHVYVSRALPPPPATPPDVHPPPGTHGRIDPNRATAEALQALPGIDAAKAAAILADRARNGPYPSCADLTRVVGIGPATLSAVGDLCEISQ